jgi:hypothetical protein
MFDNRNWRHRYFLLAKVGIAGSNPFARSRHRTAQELWQIDRPKD